MTIQELYATIGGDYTQATRVLRVDRLIDKHIRRLPQSGVVDRLLEAGKGMDPTELFEASHATKGVCANLGLTNLAGAASVIAEEFRPGNPRTMSDAEVTAKLDEIAVMYARAVEGIQQYAQA